MSVILHFQPSVAFCVLGVRLVMTLENCIWGGGAVAEKPTVVSSQQGLTADVGVRIQTLASEACNLH